MTKKEAIELANRIIDSVTYEVDAYPYLEEDMDEYCVEISSLVTNRKFAYACETEDGYELTTAAGAMESTVEVDTLKQLVREIDRANPASKYPGKFMKRESKIPSFKSYRNKVNEDEEIGGTNPANFEKYRQDVKSAFKNLLDTAKRRGLEIMYDMSKGEFFVTAKNTAREINNIYCDGNRGYFGDTEEGKRTIEMGSISAEAPFYFV